MKRDWKRCLLAVLVAAMPLLAACARTDTSPKTTARPTTSAQTEPPARPAQPIADAQVVPAADYRARDTSDNRYREPLQPLRSPVLRRLPTPETYGDARADNLADSGRNRFEQRSPYDDRRRVDDRGRIDERDRFDERPRFDERDRRDITPRDQERERFWDDSAPQRDSRGYDYDDRSYSEPRRRSDDRQQDRRDERAWNDYQPDYVDRYPRDRFEEPSPRGRRYRDEGQRDPRVHNDRRFEDRFDDERHQDERAERYTTNDRRELQRPADYPRSEPIDRDPRRLPDEPADGELRVKLRPKQLPDQRPIQREVEEIPVEDSNSPVGPEPKVTATTPAKSSAVGGQKIAKIPPVKATAPSPTDAAGADETSIATSTPAIENSPETPADTTKLETQSGAATDAKPSTLAPELTPPATNGEASLRPFVPNLAPQSEPLPGTTAGPNPAIAAVASRADGLARNAMSLARRGAVYSARAELIQALRLISQALDAEAGTQVRGQRLSAGLRALEEADDFSPQGAQLDADMNIRSIIATHKTTLLKDVDPKTVQPLAAMQHYYTFAQEQIASACGHEPAASLALFGLGRLYTSMNDQSSQFGAMSGPKAIVFHQAAMLVDGANYRAANELGVLLAKYGQLQQAREALQLSVSVYPMAETWHNLSVVHARLGEVQLARQAHIQSQTAPRAAGVTPGRHPLAGMVQWMPPQQFAQGSQRAEGDWMMPNNPAAMPPSGPGMPRQPMPPQATPMNSAATARGLWSPLPR